MENKENAYLTCSCAKECYLGYLKSELYNIARKTNKPEDWKKWEKVPIIGMLIDCFNMDCLMLKDHKQAMENLKNK